MLLLAGLAVCTLYNYVYICIHMCIYIYIYIRIYIYIYLDVCFVSLLSWTPPSPAELHLGVRHGRIAAHASRGS